MEIKQNEDQLGILNKICFEFGRIVWLLLPLKKSENRRLSHDFAEIGSWLFAQISFMVGESFENYPLLEPTFLVFLLNFPWYKKNAQS